MPNVKRTSIGRVATALGIGIAIVVSVILYTAMANRRCPIHRAAYDGTLTAQMVEAFLPVDLERPCDLGIRLHDYQLLSWLDRSLPPIFYAVLGQSIDAVHLLIAGGARIDSRDTFDRTPLHFAVRMQNEELVRALITLGADVNERDHRHRTPLHCALDSEDIHAPSLLVLLSGGADVNAPTLNGGITPLYYSSAYGDVFATELLIEHGADVNARRLDSGGTPLTAAAWNGNWECVEILLKYGADVSLPERFRSGEEKTAAEIAAERGHREIVELLTSRDGEGR